MQFDIFLAIAVVFAFLTVRRAWASQEKLQYLLAGFWILMVLRYFLHLPILIFPALICLIAYWLGQWQRSRGGKEEG